jgi:hypothetical protein
VTIERGLSGLVVTLCWLGIVATLALSGFLKLRYRNTIIPALRVLGIGTDASRLWLSRILPWFELALAAWLASGWQFAASTVVSFGLVVMFNLSLWRLLSRGYQGGCGCFGEVSSGPIQTVHLVRNGVLLVAALCLVRFAWSGNGAVAPLWAVGVGPLLRVVLFIGLLVALYVLAAAAERLLFRAYWR